MKKLDIGVTIGITLLGVYVVYNLYEQSIAEMIKITETIEEIIPSDDEEQRKYREPSYLVIWSSGNHQTNSQTS